MESEQVGTPEMAEEVESQRLGHQERSSFSGLVMGLWGLLLLLLGLFGEREKGRENLVLVVVLMMGNIMDSEMVEFVGLWGWVETGGDASTFFDDLNFGLLLMHLHLH